jgi:hypothetical protein
MKGLQSQPMKTARTLQAELEYRRPFLASAGWVLWKALRLPIAGVLLLLEPVVNFICSAGLVLGLITCVIFELSAVAPRFPLLKCLGVSLSFGAILFVYYGLVSVFVED